MLVGRAPDGGEDLTMRHHPAHALGEAGQEIVLLGGQFHRRAGPGDPAVDQVDLHLAGSDHRFGAVAMQAMAHGDPQPGQQFSDAEGLFNVVVGAGVEGVDLLCLPVPGRKDQDRAIVEGAGLPEGLLAIHVRQAEVEHHRFGRLSGDFALSMKSIATLERESEERVVPMGAGNDRLEGNLGSDILIGGTGNDTLIGGGHDASSPDYFFGGTGNDTYYVNSAMTGAQDLVDEGEGNPALAGGATDVDTIISQGALFWDFYSVGENLQIDRDAGGQIVGGRNVLNKIITGDIGNDIILTYGRSSVVDAGAGTDAISFELYGLGESYEGSNTLIMKPGNGMDYLYGFESGEDKIDLRGFGYGLTGAQWQSFLVDVENGDNDYCFLYLGQPGQYLVFVGVTSSQITAGDFLG